MAEAAPHGRCTFHVEVAIDKESGLRAGPSCEPARVVERPFVIYPPRYRRWARKKGIEAPPTRYAEACPAAPLPRDNGKYQVVVRFPTQGDVFHIDPDLRRDAQSLPLEADVRGTPRGKLRWLVNGSVVARAPFPYSATWRIKRGRHRVEAELSDGTRSNAVTISIR